MEQRTNERFQEVREDIKEVRAHVDTSAADLRAEIRANRLFKNSRFGLAVAIVVGTAVVGTFVLQLLDAIF